MRPLKSPTARIGNAIYHCNSCTAGSRAYRVTNHDGHGDGATVRIIGSGSSCCFGQTGIGWNRCISRGQGRGVSGAGNSGCDRDSGSAGEAVRNGGVVYKLRAPVIQKIRIGVNISNGLAKISRHARGINNGSVSASRARGLNL